MTREMRDAPQFYLTAPSPCPYLPGLEERKVFTHLVGKRAIALNDTLTQTGFRRSQTIAYRPGLRELPRLRLRAGDRRRIPPEREPAPRPARQRRSRRRGRAGQADRRAIRAVSRLSRRPPPRRRHGRHVDARLFHDGRGQPRRHPVHRISAGAGRPRPVAARARCSASASPTGSATACRWSIRFTRREESKPLARHLHDPRPYRARRAGSACRTSISAIGSRARRRWPTRPPTCRRSGSGLNGWVRVER